MNNPLFFPTRLLITSILVIALWGCASAPSPAVHTLNSVESASYLKRADTQARTQEQVEVKVAVLREDESLADFGLPLAEKGIQPVWPVGKIRAKSATGINFYSGRVVQVGIDSGFRSVG